MLELKDLQRDEGCRGAGAAVQGLAEVKPDSSDAGQGGTLQPSDAQVCSVAIE